MVVLHLNLLTEVAYKELLCSRNIHFITRNLFTKTIYSYNTQRRLLFYSFIQIKYLLHPHSMMTTITSLQRFLLLFRRPIQLYIVCLCFQVLLHLSVSAPRINYFVCSGARRELQLHLAGFPDTRQLMASSAFISSTHNVVRYLFEFHFFYLKGLSHGRDLAFDDMYGQF
jgi:hypothetical protein